MFSPSDLEIVWMTSKKIGHLFYTRSSFVHHFKSIGEFKLMLHSGHDQFGSKSAVYFPMRPWNLMDDHGKYFGTFSILSQAVCGHVELVSKSTIFVLCDFEIWQMTLKGYRAPLHTTSNFVHHFQAIDEFKLELQFKIEDFLVPCDL